MKISLTTEELISGSERINKISEEILGLLTALKSDVDGVCAEWEGAAQNSFFESFNTIHAEFVSTFPPAVDGIAEQMKTAATKMDEVDQQLSSAFSG